MSIVKGNLEYFIEEKEDCWVVAYTIDNLKFSYKVSKTRCETFKDLKKLLTSDKLFAV